MVSPLGWVWTAVITIAPVVSASILCDTRSKLFNRLKFRPGKVNSSHTYNRIALVALITLLVAGCMGARSTAPVPAVLAPPLSFDPQGEWEYEEKGRSIVITLDANGSGDYQWKKGRIITTEISGRSWKGRWIQRANDREGGFELLLTEDYAQAEGLWWYTRIGNNTAPKKKGGRFRMIRLD